MQDILLQLKSVTKSFTKDDGLEQKILDNISLTVASGEIIALLGKSGSGKSTILRIISGLIAPTSGVVEYGQGAGGAELGISMIFQNFALFPWLTVLENVELGLEALGAPKRERRIKALKSIDLIGLDGFESAYPRELSGGMKQRVGFARGLVVNPDILLMDEPFSALDVLTSDTLKHDFLDLWATKKTSLKAVLIVTHSIEEAVFMADRAIILGSNPGHIISEIPINLTRPRDIRSEAFQMMVDKIYGEMAASMHKAHAEAGISKSPRDIAVIYKLPSVSANQLAAFTAALVDTPYNGTGELSELVQYLRIKTPDIFHISEALALLKFANVKDGVIRLSQEGRAFASGDLATRKHIFAQNMLSHIPLAAYIVKILNERPSNKAPRTRFLTYLEDHLTRVEAASTLRTMINWGRYGEIFAYDDNKQQFSLDNPS